MKIIKIIGITIGIFLITLFSCFLGWYNLIYKPTNSQKVIKTSEINNPENKTKLLIASQGSDYKIKLVNKITNELKEKDIYIKIIDITELSNINNEKWDSIIIINICEKWKMQKSVRIFLSDSKNIDNIILITTSGSGTWKTKKYNIDTITSASEMENIDNIKNLILSKLNNTIDLNNIN